GFAGEWIDYERDGVYQNTRVRLRFTSDEPSTEELKYDAQATYETPKYSDLEQFQTHLAVVVAQRMRDELSANGRVAWTSRLTLLGDGIEFAKKASDEPVVISFARITHWEVDRGLFKLAIDDSQRPNIAEKTNPLNFYPGLVLFAELAEQARADGYHPALMQ